MRLWQCRVKLLKTRLRKLNRAVRSVRRCFEINTGSLRQGTDVIDHDAAHALRRCWAKIGAELGIGFATKRLCCLIDSEVMGRIAAHLLTVLAYHLE